MLSDTALDTITSHSRSCKSANWRRSFVDQGLDPGGGSGGKKLYHRRLAVIEPSQSIADLKTSGARSTKLRTVFASNSFEMEKPLRWRDRIASGPTSGGPPKRLRIPPEGGRRSGGSPPDLRTPAPARTSGGTRLAMPSLAFGTEGDSGAPSFA